MPDLSPEDRAYADAQRIIWPGAVNPAAVTAVLARHASALTSQLRDTQAVRDHPALRAIAAQAAMLFRVDQMGAPPEVYDTVERHAASISPESTPAAAGPPQAAAATPGTAAGQRNEYTFDIAALTTVKVRAATEGEARGMIDGLTSITTRTAGDGIETAYGLDVSTSDCDVVEVSPRGRGYLVSAETRDGEEISVTADEIFPDLIRPSDLAGLRGKLAAADRALAGDNSDADLDALHGLAEAVRGLFGGSGHPETGEAGTWAGQAAGPGGPHVQPTGPGQAGMGFPGPEAASPAGTFSGASQAPRRGAAPGPAGGAPAPGP